MSERGSGSTGTSEIDLERFPVRGTSLLQDGRVGVRLRSPVEFLNLIPVSPLSFPGESFWFVF